MDDSQKSLVYLSAVEKLAEDILSDKNILVILDRSRNENREALRYLKTLDEREKTWMTVTSNFMQMSSTKAIEILTEDQNKIEVEGNKIRIELKEKVDRLRDLEYKPQIRGLNLKPLSTEENDVFKGKLY